MADGHHECIQTERLKLIENDVREARRIMNGKFDRLTTNMDAGLNKIWKKLDTMAEQSTCNKISTVKNKLDIKWILMLVGMAASILMNIKELMK